MPTGTYESNNHKMSNFKTKDIVQNKLLFRCLGKVLEGILILSTACTQFPPHYFFQQIQSIDKVRLQGLYFG